MLALLFRKETILSIFLVIFLLSISFLLQLIDKRAYATEKLSNYSNNSYPNPNDLRINNSTNNIFWFIQITDTHISKFSAFDRLSDLKILCQYNLPIIKPEIVILSGDITDAKASFPSLDSIQFIEEWKAYKSVFYETGIDKKVKWLDLRGNHDVFDVKSAEASNNYFSSYSIQGRTYPGSYIYNHVKPFGKYSFVAMDATPVPGLKRPYNFFGVIVSKIANALLMFEEKIKQSNHTFWFSHYPTSTIITQNFDLKEIIGRNAIMYFCGHLHTLGGLCKNMYTLQPEGYLELELADWRDNRGMRLVAVDHDLVSFTDFHLEANNLGNSWPIAIITNPKRADFLMPLKEPVSRIITSTHIRILAWSDVPIINITVFIDNIYLGRAKPTELTHNTGGLYSLEWEPQIYAKEYTREIHVVVQDELNRKLEISQLFSAQGIPSWNLQLFANLLLSNNLYSLIHFTLILVWLLEFVFLITFRLMYRREKTRSCMLNRSWLTRGIWRLCCNNLLFYSKILELAYEVCGPVFFGYLLTNSMTIVFPYGAWVNNSFHYLSFTIIDQILYVSCFLSFYFNQSLLYKWPMQLVIIWVMSRSVVPINRNSKTNNTSQNRKCLYFFVMVIVVILNFFLVFRIYKFIMGPAGYFSFLTAPGRTGAMIFNLIYLIYVLKINRILTV